VADIQLDSTHLWQYYVNLRIYEITKQRTIDTVGMFTMTQIQTIWHESASVKKTTVRLLIFFHKLSTLFSGEL